jgi:PAS domain S-box-containing protein
VQGSRTGLIPMPGPKPGLYSRGTTSSSLGAARNDGRMSLSIASTTPSVALHDEPARLAELRRLNLVETPADPLFDDLAAVAAAVCTAPVALVSLVDEHRQWCKARVGPWPADSSRDLSLCARAITQPDDLLEVTDARSDPRLAGHPLVQGDAGLRFYAGAPIVTRSGHALGTVCVIDHVPRTLTDAQRLSLRALSRQAAGLIEQAAPHAAAPDAGEHAAQREQLRMATSRFTHSLDLQSYVDRNYVYRYVNDRYLAYWARRREEIEGRTMGQLIGEDLFKEQVKPHIDRAFAGDIETYETTIDYPGRGRRHARVTFLPVHDDRQQVCAVVMRVEDVDELMAAQDELRRTVDLLERRTDEQQRFIHMISHDLREPLNTICNFTDLLEQDHAQALDVRGRQYLRFVAQGGQRMRGLLDGLLDYVRLEGLPLQRQAVALDELLLAVRDDLALALSRSGGSLDAGPLPTVDADPTLLRLLVQNLVSNAIKFHAPGAAPEVTVRDHSTAQHWRLAVSDRGIGIAAEHQPRLFGLFRRLRPRREFEGTGLGLAICRRIAELHDGHIDVQSEPGLGSTFTLVLPRPAPIA